VIGKDGGSRATGFLEVWIRPSQDGQPTMYCWCPLEDRLESPSVAGSGTEMSVQVGWRIGSVGSIGTPNSKLEAVALGSDSICGIPKLSSRLLLHG
jgi:hypothetical protein